MIIEENKNNLGHVRMVQPLIGYVGEHQVTVEIGEYGPEFAENYLKKIIINRPLNKANINKLVKEIEAGRYMLNGDAFRYDRNGNAADGAHTAQAIVETGSSIPRLVIRGLDPTAFRTIDRGAKRKLSDDLNLEGIDYSREVAAAARLAYALEIRSGQPSHKDMTDSEVFEYFKKNPELAEYAKTHALKDKSLVPPSVVAAFHYLFAKKDKELADTFITQLVTGANISIDSGLCILRKVLVDNITAKRKLKKVYVLAYIIKCWNSARQNLPVKTLKYARRGKNAEQFPQIH